MSPCYLTDNSNEARAKQDSSPHRDVHTLWPPFLSRSISALLPLLHCVPCAVFLIHIPYARQLLPTTGLLPLFLLLASPSTRAFSGSFQKPPLWRGLCHLLSLGSPRLQPTTPQLFSISSQRGSVHSCAHDLC